MRGIFNFFGQVGVLVITILTGYLYDLIGPSVIFIIVGSLDALLALTTISLTLLGYIKNREVKSDAKLIP